MSRDLYMVSLPMADDPYAAAFLCAECRKMFPAAHYRPTSARVACDHCGSGSRLQRAKRLRDGWFKRLREAVKR